MNARATEILSNPQPCGHIVYPYTDESQVTDAVCLFASAGLRKGESVLLVMTHAHCGPVLLSRLKESGHDVEKLTSTGQLVCEDAAKLLSSFLFDGIIDEYVFKSKISEMIANAKAAGGERPVRVFGEMASLIWESRPQATERLEELWNQVIQQHSVPLLCAYALSGTTPDQFPHSLLSKHSHALA